MYGQSKVSNQYYIGDLPGTLQYNVDPKKLIETPVPDNNEDWGFKTIEEQQYMEKMRLAIPYTRRKEEYVPILIMEADVQREKWVKIAMWNKKTGKISLLTSTNCRENIERRGQRAIKTVDGVWFVGHYRMAAPAIFWQELKNRLIIQETGLQLIKRLYSD
jgi:hypothetical protein